MDPSVSFTPEIAFVLLVIAVVFAGFVSEWRSPDVIALGGAGALLATGIIGLDDLRAALGNPGVVTIGALFVVSGSLERTGVIDRLGGYAMRAAELGPVRARLLMLAAVMLVSGVINNTPVVMVLAPVAIRLAQKLETLPSKLLIPLSYASILGGACTVIGTSTNLIINGVAQEHGLEPFGIFEITLPGVVIGLVGIAYLMVVGRWLLPERQPLSSANDEQSQRDFVTELLIPEDSELVGSSLGDTELEGRDDVHIVELRRGDRSLSVDGSIELASGDRIVVQSHAGNVLELRGLLDPREATPDDQPLSEEARIAGFQPVRHQSTRIMEGIVGPDSRFLGQKIGHLNLQRAFGVTILAVHRHGETLTEFEDEKLQFGDTLLLEASEENLRHLFAEQDLANLSEPAARVRKRAHAPLALGAVVLLVGLAALDVLPIAVLAALAAIGLLLARSVSPEEAYRTIDWRILFLIVGTLAIGRAMQTTGAAAWLVGQLAGPFLQLGPWALLAAVYVTASLMTETITNNAVAALLTPLVIGLANQIGADPRPFVVAVMFAASASFATPLGYQTNTIVYGAGNYRFTDFVRIGLPMNVLVAAMAVALIPVFWPFEA